MSKVMTALDTTRSVFRLSGADARDFLQQLVTNDVDLLTPGAALYAALLTPQGKYLGDFILVDTGESILLDAHVAQAEALLKRLGMYKLRAAVDIEPVVMNVLLTWCEGSSLPPATAHDVCIADPRHPQLGRRSYLKVCPILEIDDPDAYDLHRLRLGIPLAEADLILNETYILEAGFEALGGVDFKKGCYVGQEIVARMKHKAKLKKRYVQVEVSSAQPAGTPVLNEEGKSAGILYSNREGIGLAHLRLDRCQGTLQAGEAAIQIVEAQRT